MALNVLITGGTGLIGTRLTEMLLEKGYEVSYLSRRDEKIPNVKVYQWNPAKGELDHEALENADFLINLAGAGIADARWTAERKKEIIQSRTLGISLIANRLQSRRFKMKAFLGASAIGFYGADTGDEPLDETHTSGLDFLAHVTRQWETASELIENVGIRAVTLRIGIVLSTKGGALPKIALPVRYGVGSPLASGKQWTSWIHIDDLCQLFIAGIENADWNGTYNAVAPNPVTNADFTRQIADVLKRPLWLPNVPSFILFLIYGELARVVLGGNYVVNQRLKQTNFKYQFENVKDALKHLLTA